jgi:RNA polymerase sigma-70 factor (ECF subfamily)
LPAPIATGDDAVLPAYEIPAGVAGSTEGRYELLESVSLAFLLALEALTPSQRAVLLLRDVFDYSVREVAGALGMSEVNVKVTHHRARRAMAAYDRERCVQTRDLQDRTRTALERFLTALSTADGAAMETLLADDVRHLSDGGEYAAAHRIVLGRDRVMRLLFGLNRRARQTAVSVCNLNGLPALLLDFGPRKPPVAPRGTLGIVLGADGRIAAIHAVLASRKLTAVPF